MASSLCNRLRSLTQHGVSHRTCRAYRQLLKLRKKVKKLPARVLPAHFLDRFERRDGALVLQRDKRVTPFVGEEIVHAAQMLSQLDKNRPVLLERAESAFGASQVAGLELLVVIWLVVELEHMAIATQKKRVSATAPYVHRLKNEHTL